MCRFTAFLSELFELVCGRLLLQELYVPCNQTLPCFTDNVTYYCSSATFQKYILWNGFVSIGEHTSIVLRILCGSQRFIPHARLEGSIAHLLHAVVSYSTESGVWCRYFEAMLPDRFPFTYALQHRLTVSDGISILSNRSDDMLISTLLGSNL